MRAFPLYQPRIQDKNVRRLYRLKVETGIPMTRLVNTIIEQFFRDRYSSIVKETMPRIDVESRPLTLSRGESGSAA